MAAAAAVKLALATAPARPDDRGSPLALDVDRGKWTWRVTVGGQTVAVSIHAYVRRAEAVRAIDQFAEALRGAETHVGTARHFGPHTLRDFERPLPVSGNAAAGVKA